VVSGSFIDRVIPFINDIAAYMKDVSHTVLILGTPGCLPEETDKNMKINGLGIVYRDKPVEELDSLGCTHVVAYDTEAKDVHFTIRVDVHIAFSKYPQPLSLQIGWMIVAEDVAPHGAVQMVTEVPTRYRAQIDNQERVKSEYRKHNTSAQVAWEAIPRARDISILAISVKRMIRGLI